MKKTRTAIMILAMGAFLCSLVWFGLRFCHTSPIFHARVECAEPTRNLGTIEGGSLAPVEFTLKNSGGRHLTIGRVKPGCGGCVKIVGTPNQPVSPGSLCTIQVSLVTDTLQGAIEKTVFVESNDPVNPWLTLRIKAVVEVRPSSQGAGAEPVEQLEVSQGFP